MKCIEFLRKKARALEKEITVLFYAYHDPGTGLLPKILIFLTLGYALSPIDFIPDFIPVLGYLDDLIIIPAMITVSIKLIPEDVLMASRERAQREPVKLKKNWLFAALFVFIWTALVIVIILSLVRLFTG